MTEPALAAEDEVPAAVGETVAWAHGLVLRFLRRYGHRLLQAGGQLSDLFVDPSEARAVLSPGLYEALRLPEVPEPGPMPDGLQGRLGLSSLDAALLLAAAAPSLSVDVARLYTFAWADFSQKLPTVGFLAELVGLPGGRGRFAADAPLVRRGLVRLVDGERWSPGGPRLHRGVVVSEAVVDWLAGEPSRPESLVQAAVWQGPLAAELWWPANAEVVLRGAIEAAVAERGRLVMQGRPGCGRRSLVRAVLAGLGRDLLVVDLARVGAGGLALADQLVSLQAGVLLLRVPSTLEEDRAAELAELLLWGQSPIVLTVDQAEGVLASADLVRVVVPEPGAALQRRLWQRALAEAGVEASADLLDACASRLELTPGAIQTTAQSLARAGNLTAAGVGAALHGQVRHTLGAVAEPVQTTLTWDDVVLPSDVLEVLREVIGQARYRAQVFDAWGFRRKMSYGRGLSCLFAGPPGTGKTMVAGIIATDLGRPLYRVDLSRLVSKWVGETEKNLARVFDDAERAQVILLFDEADSLFATRTEVRGAQDRFANMEVNYLLQRMEQFDGMSILTTNFERGLDEAFRRRLRFRVQFPLPEADERTRLWQKMLPPALPVAEDVRWGELGKRYNLSGGSIKNAVLRAAFRAAAQGGVVTEALLMQAADAEKREMGKL